MACTHTDCLYVHTSQQQTVCCGDETNLKFFEKRLKAERQVKKTGGWVTSIFNVVFAIRSENAL